MVNILTKCKFIVILFLFLLHSVIYSDIKYYKSNDIGMKLSEINPEDFITYEYVLTIENAKDFEERKLYLDNELVQRWEFIFYNNKNIREEREFDADTLSNLRYYDRRGRLIEEHTYSDNQFRQKTIFIYGENQQLSQAKTYDIEGILIYYENYEFNRQGMIRRVRRVWPDGGFHVSSFIYGKGRLVEEIFSTDEEMTISRYDMTGQLSNITVWREEKAISKTFFTYNEDGSLLSSLENDLVMKFNTENIYNEEGRLHKKIVSKSDLTISEDTYFYDQEGRKSKMSRISDRGLEEWAFYYDQEGELNQEDYFRRGVLEKRTIYTSDNSYHEELFRYGELLIRVYYEDEAKIKEEFLENGEVIKVNNMAIEE